MKANDFLSGVLIGAVVGAVAGLLLAPQSGEETRETIREYAGELNGKVRETGRHLAESSRDLIDQGKLQVEQAMQRGRETMEQFSSRLDKPADDNA